MAAFLSAAEYCGSRKSLTNGLNLLRIIQISDCHLYADLNKCGYGNIKPSHSLRTVVSLAEEQAPDLLVVTGDLSSDDSIESYRHILSIITESNLRCDVRIIPGNHDSVSAMQAVFPAHWLLQNEHEQRGEWQLFFLDSQYQGTQGRLSEDTLHWLAHTIKAVQQPSLVFIHHHPIASHSFMDNHRFINADDFLGVLKESTHPVYVCHGHIHHASEKQEQGIQVWSAPSTCWQWAMTQDFGITNELPGLRVIDLDKQTITTQILRI